MIPLLIPHYDNTLKIFLSHRNNKKGAVLAKKKELGYRHV